MYSIRNRRPATWHLLLVFAIAVAVLGAFAPTARAESYVSEPPYELPATWAVVWPEPWDWDATASPDYASACAQPGVPILPDPGVAATYSESSYQRTQFQGANAFDGAASTKWISKYREELAWVAVDLGSELYRVTSYDVAYSNGLRSDFAPRDWSLQGRAPGGDWTPIDYRGGEGDWSLDETRTFTVQQPGLFSEYRLFVTQDNGDSSDVTMTAIDELRLYVDCPLPEILISHTIVPMYAFCPTTYDDAVAANPAGSNTALEVANGTVVNHCINIKNVGPGVAATVRFNHPLFEDLVLTNFVGETWRHTRSTVRNYSDGQSIVTATATNWLGDETAPVSDSFELKVFDGFEVQVAAVEQGTPCPADLSTPSGFPQATHVEIGRTVILCYSVISTTDMPIQGLSVSHSLTNGEPSFGNFQPYGHLRHSENHVVSADDAGFSTVLLRIENQLGEFATVDGTDLYLIPINGDPETTTN